MGNHLSEKKPQPRLNKGDANLAVSTASLELVLTNLSEGVCVIAENMQILYANYAFANLIRRPLQELAGIPLWQAMPQIKPVLQRHTQVMPRQLTAPMLAALMGEYNLGSLSRPRFVNLDVSRIPGIDQIVILLHDVNDQKNHEAAMLHKERQLNEAQSIAHLGSWEWDIKTDVVTLSDELCRIYGIETPFAARYVDYLQCIHPRDRDMVGETFANALEHQPSFDLYHRIVRPTGRVRIVHALGNAVYDAHSAVIGIVGTGQDVTEVKLRERKLRKYTREVVRSRAKIKRENARFEAIISSIGKGLIAINNDTVIVLANRMAAEMFGWDQTEMVGQICTEIIDCIDDNGNPVPAGQGPLEQALAQKKRVYSTEYYYSRKDGSTFPASITVTPILLKQKIIGSIMVFRDITEDRLADRAKLEFVSIASHELRTPLSAINWYVEMLQSGDAGKLKPDQRKFVDEIYAGNQRMIALVNDLLNVSRLELGTFAISPIRVDVAEIAHQLVSDLGHQISAKKLIMHEHYAKQLPRLNADPKLLRIVFQNLLSNAIKYTPPGGEIFFSITKDDQEVLVTVKDTGLGIPQYQFPQVFNKLFRADNARDTEVEGTGLGLYIVKSIIEQSGGKIWFESTETLGTTFYFALPFQGMTPKNGHKSLIK